MYGQMTAGSWIYIGSQGIVQGTYETFVEMGRRHFGGIAQGRWILTAGLGGMGGAQPLAGRRWPAPRCSRSSASRRASRCACAPATSTSGREALDEALAIIERSVQGQASRSRSACSATPPMSCRSWCGAASGPTSSPTRPRRTIRSTAICRRAGRSPSGRSAASSDPKGVERGRARLDGRARARDARLSAHAACPTVDYGNNIRQMALEEGVADAFDFPGLRAGLYPPAVLPRHRAVPLGGAVGRSRGHLPHRREGEGTDPGQRASAQLARHGARAHPLPGPAGAHLLGRPRRPPPARPRLQRDGGEAASSRRRSSSAAIISIPARSPRPTARPRRCGTARTRCPTGRCSTRCSTAPAARPGCRCITAAASAWAIPSMPAW